MSKKKGGKAPASAKADDDDWDAILAAETALRAASAPAEAPPAVAEGDEVDLNMINTIILYKL